MEWFLGILAGSILLLLAHMKFANSFSSKSKEPADDPALQELSQFIDSSLKGYPERVRYKDVYGAHVWTCHSRLFTIQISLSKTTIRYRFQVSFFHDLPFRFTIRRSRIQKTMKVAGSSGKLTEKLLSEKEMTPFIQKLSFYDSVRVTKSGVYGSKAVSGIAGLAEWPKALGASITFVRFLLNYDDRKEALKPEDALCPYCRGMITTGEKVVSCSKCRTAHHQDCWNETDRCSIFGCGSKSELELQNEP